ncbi:MAG: hypothetical protein RSB73_01610, partial [Bacteroidales bacterium]
MLIKHIRNIFIALIGVLCFITVSAQRIGNELKSPQIKQKDTLLVKKTDSLVLRKDSLTLAKDSAALAKDSIRLRGSLEFPVFSTAR